MSSNHKAPLTAFVVVAIACVVVLATNSMRSYAKDAWSSFAAPVVAGLQLMEIQQGETLQPSAPEKAAAPATGDTTRVVAAHASAVQLGRPPIIPATHITRAFHAHPAVHPHSQPKHAVAPVTTVKPVAPFVPVTHASHGGPKHDPISSTPSGATPGSAPDHGWGAPHGHAAHTSATGPGRSSHSASKHGGPSPVLSTRTDSYDDSGSTVGTVGKGHGPAHGHGSAAPGHGSHAMTAPGNSGFGHSHASGTGPGAHGHSGH